jgi:GTPase involved in cell partitioning and DNA repair
MKFFDEATIEVVAGKGGNDLGRFSSGITFAPAKVSLH